MDLNEAKRLVTARIYAAALVFRDLEEQGLIHGNGKAIAHGINAMCIELLEGRWKKPRIKKETGA